MKDPWNWEEEDIELLIRDRVQESLTLDYKRCASLDRNNPKRRTELSKDVSAFANSAGGTIVYGVIENNHLPEKIDVGYDPSVITREWIEQVINSNIQRRIDGLRIKSVELTKSNPGKVIYVVSVPQSRRAPHMAQDHVYYKRYNYQSVPMEEYEVRDVAGRDDVPDLFLKVYLPAGAPALVFNGDNTLSQPISINVLIGNESNTIALYYIVRLFLDREIIINHPGRFKSYKDTEITLRSNRFIVTQLARNCGIPETMPVWQGQTYLLGDPHVSISLPKGQKDSCADYLVAGSVDAPGMESRITVAALRVANGQLSLVDIEPGDS